MTEGAPVLNREPVEEGPLTNGASGRILRGLAANTGGVGITLVIQLLSVPVLLAAWGVPTYGEWLVLSAIPTYLALSDLSFSSVAANSMMMLVAQDRRRDAITLGRRLWSIVTATTAIAVIGAVGIAIIFGRAFGDGGAIPASEAQVVLVALFLQVAVGNQYGVVNAWFLAGGLYPLSTTLRQLGRLAEFGALMGVVLLGATPGVAAIAFLVGSVMGFLVSLAVLRRKVPWSTFQVDVPHRQTFRELLAPGIAFMAFPLGNALSLQGFTIVIGTTLGAAAVVIFSTTRTLTRVALQAVGTVNTAIWPELSRSVGGGQRAEAREILRRSVQLALLGSLALVAGLALFGVGIVRWWTRGLVDPPLQLLLVLLLVIVANSTWYTLSSVLVATNRHKRMAVVYLIGTSGALFAAVPCSTLLGLEGAALTLLAIDIAMLLYVFPVTLKVVEDPPAQFLRAMIDVSGAVRSARSLKKKIV